MIEEVEVEVVMKMVATADGMKVPLAFFSFESVFE